MEEVPGVVVVLEDNLVRQFFCSTFISAEQIDWRLRPAVSGVKDVFLAKQVIFKPWKFSLMFFIPKMVHN